MNGGTGSSVRNSGPVWSRPLSVFRSSRPSCCFLVSINFLSYSIDNWFSIRIGDALNRTLEVAQIYYQQSADQAKDYARQISADISKNSLYEGGKFLYLKALVEARHKTYKLNMLEVHIENQKDNLVVGNRDYPQILPKPLSAKSLEDVYAGRELTTIEQAGNGDLDPGGLPHLFASRARGGDRIRHGQLLFSGRSGGQDQRDLQDLRRISATDASEKRRLNSAISSRCS